MRKFIDRRDFIGAGSAAVASIGLASRLSPLQAQSLKPLSFQLSWIKSIQYGGYFGAIDQGFYKKRGIEATFNSGGPNVDPIANVASGRSGIGDRPIGPIIIAKEKGIPIKVIATVFQKSPYSIISLAEKPIKTVKDLVGKTIAVATSGRPLMLNLLRDAGIDPKSVNMVPSSPDPSALVSGQIDAYNGYSTNQGVMLQTRGVKIHVLNVHDLGLPETVGTIYGREDYLAANRDLVVSFLKASIEGWKWALDNPEPTAKFMVEKYGNPGLDYKAQLTEVKESKPYIASATNPLLAIDVPTFEKIIEVYRKVDLVKSRMTVKELCDTSFIEAAHRA